MIDVIEYKGSVYPKFQTEGFASQYAFPFALKICKGVGYDVGCSKLEWALPGSIPVDIAFDDHYHANNLPDASPDYIFSSHCLEHVDHWVDTLKYWTDKLKSNGCLFLYLPDFSQAYWRPWNNTKHRHVFTPEIIGECLKALGYKNVFISGIDLNNSFIAFGEKP
jgi:predicted SAM-dependent methyltransferase